MLSVTIVSLKIPTGTFCNCMSYEKVLIMARGKELSDSQKALTVKLWKDGERNIPNNLNIPFTTKSSFIAGFKRRNTVENKKEQLLQRKFLLDYKENLAAWLTKIQWLRVKNCSSSGCSVITGLMSNEMLRNDLKSRRPNKTPLLLKRHGDAGLKFVRKLKEKENSFWERILWTDETKIEVFGNNYRNHVWRKEGEAYSSNNTVPTVKYGRDSIMIISNRW